MSRLAAPQVAARRAACRNQEAGGRTAPRTDRSPWAVFPMFLRLGLSPFGGPVEDRKFDRNPGSLFGPAPRRQLRTCVQSFLAYCNIRCPAMLDA